MANAALLNIPQFLGPSYSGYKYYFYEITSSTPKNAYNSSSGSSGSSLDNPLTLNSNGSTTTGIWGTGYYRVILKDSSGTTVFDWDNVSGGENVSASSGAGSESVLNPADNIFVNPVFNHWAADATSKSGVTDGTFSGAQNYYILSQSGNVDTSRLTSTSDTSSTYALRMTNAHASAQRLGVLQYSSASSLPPMIGNTVRGQIRVRCSSTTTVFVVLVAWLNTTTPTIDIVNDWTSPTFTEGNFFISSSDVEIIGYTSSSCSASTWTSISMSGTVPSNAKRLIMLVWTGDTLSAAGTFDVHSFAGYESTSSESFRTLAGRIDKAASGLEAIKPIDPSSSVTIGSSTSVTLSNSTTITGGGVAIALPTVATTMPTVQSTAGQVLHASDASGTQAYKTFGYQYIGKFTASAAARLAITGLAGYECVEIYFHNVFPATDNTSLYCQVSVDNGANYEGGAGSYAWVNHVRHVTAVASTASSSDTKIILIDKTSAGMGNASFENWDGKLTLYNISGTSARKSMTFHAEYTDQNTGTPAIVFAGARNLASSLYTSAVNALNIYADSGNITGTAYVFGVKSALLV